jgi:hypothetical protein
MEDIAIPTNAEIIVLREEENWADAVRCGGEESFRISVSPHSTGPRVYSETSSTKETADGEYMVLGGDGRKAQGQEMGKKCGDRDGGGIGDCGIGVWSWYGKYFCTALCVATRAPKLRGLC